MKYLGLISVHLMEDFLIKKDYIWCYMLSRALKNLSTYTYLTNISSLLFFLLHLLLLQLHWFFEVNSRSRKLFISHNSGYSVDSDFFRFKMFRGGTDLSSLYFEILIINRRSSFSIFSNTFMIIIRK